VTATGPLAGDLAGGVSPAWAEPAPSDHRAAATPFRDGSGSVIELPELGGYTRLGSPSLVSVSVPVTVTRPSRAEVSLYLDGRPCTTTTLVPVGRSSVLVHCRVTATPGDLPVLRAPVVVRLTTLASGTTGFSAASSVRRVVASWTVTDGSLRGVDEAAARWRRLADALAARSDTVEEPVFGAAFDAAAVTREALEHGWQSSHVQDRLAILLATRKPGGGYGLTSAWDAYGDGTVNPASTTYTVTSAGHVGSVLLEAYRQGVLPEAALRAVVDAVLAVPRLDHGTCLAYSSSRWDAAKPCVRNVSLGAAAWLRSVRNVTPYRGAEIDSVVAAVRSRIRDGYDPSTGYWTYADGARGPQDLGHQVYTAASVDLLDPSFGAVGRMMQRPWWRQPNGTDQPPYVIASSMMTVAMQCQYARSPGVIAGAEQALAPGSPPFTVIEMANAARQVLRSCFGLTDSVAQNPVPAPIGALLG